MSSVPRSLCVLQPGYLPWLGFFDQMARSDIFVFYDDVQFDKNGWRNRNRVKSPQGPHWLTVPVRGGLGQSILDVRIDDAQPWARKHVSTLRHLYGRARYFRAYQTELEEILLRPWSHLVDLDLAVVALLCRWLGLERETHRSSRLGVGGERSVRLLALCRHFGCDRYLSGDAARSYLDAASFAKAGVEVEWQNYHHPEYAQLHGAFIPHLSTIDLVLNHGDRSFDILTRRGGAEA
jgi:WbqC-like protein family